MFASKSGNHGVMKSLVDPQNQGPSCITMSLSIADRNFTMKKPLEQRCISHCVVQFVKIQRNRSADLGQKKLNLHIIDYLSYIVQCSSISGVSMLYSGV